MTTSEPVDWDARYAEPQWSGRPNASLVTEVSGMPPGRVLDVGAGEGGDAVWLARQGWDVTALDVSKVALDRGATAAAAVGVEVHWLHAGLVEADLPRGGFDLVTAHYPALPRTAAGDAERCLLAAVAPGGTLLVVHHADMTAEKAREHGFELDDYVGHEHLVALLGDGWEVEVAERRHRDAPPGPGEHHHADLVLRARRA